jgi:lysophospholipase L1-like esterase
MAADHTSSRRISTAFRRALRFAAAVIVVAAAAMCSDSSTPTSPTPPSSGSPSSAPRLTCPADVTASSGNGSPVAVSFTMTAASGGVAPVTVSCEPATGTMFPVGATTVTCTATAANGDRASCSFMVTVSTVAPGQRISRTRFLAFGDSLTAGEVTAPMQGGLSEGSSPWFAQILVPQGSYPSQLDLLLRARYVQQSASISVTNAGKLGEPATEGARRFPDVMSNLRPEVVLVLTGANDLALGSSAVAPAALAVETMAKEARFRNARVFIATMPPQRSSGTRALPASLVQTYNGRLADVARGEGAVLVDLYSALLPSVTTYIGVDGLHPTEAGYRRVAEAFFAAIRQDLELR